VEILSGKTVFILEQSGDVGAFLAFREHDTSEPHLIATTPWVCHELEKREIPFKPVEDYFIPEEEVSAGLKRFEDLDRFCEQIDSQLGQMFPVLHEFGLRLAGDNVFFLKLLLDGLAIRARILGEIIRREKPDRIAIFFPDRAHSPFLAGGQVPFGMEESIYGEILGCETLPCRVIRRKREEESGGTPGRGWKDRLQEFQKLGGRHLLMLYNPAIILRKQGITPMLSSLLYAARNRLFHGRSLVIAGAGYQWDEILPDLIRGGYQIHRLNPVETGRRGEVHETLDIPDTLLGPLCSSGGIDFSPSFRARVIPLFSYCLAEATHHRERIERQLLGAHPQAYLCATKSRFSEHMAARIARKNGVPVIGWQHGEQGFRHALMTRYTELANSDVHLVYGDGVKRTLEEDRIGSSPTIIPVGSRELEKIHQASRAQPKQGYLLYATMNYYHNSLYVGSDFILRDNETWKTQKQILEPLGESGQRTILKLHPGTWKDTHICGFLHENGYDGIRIIRNEHSFVDLLGSASLIILDFPSTTLLQAIATRLPIFSLLQHASLTKENCGLLQRRAYCSHDPTIFAGMIQDYLSGKTLDQHPNPNDTAFLEKFGIYKNDGNVGGRVTGRMNTLGNSLEKPQKQ